LKALTGKEMWAYPTAQSVGSSPAIVGGVAYFGANDHKVYGVNASTGVKIWKHSTHSPVVTSPAVVSGVVYVGEDQPGHQFYALKASTGARIWSRNLGVLYGYSSSAVAHGVVYVGSNDGKLFALKAATGATIWSDSGMREVGHPTLSDGLVYVCSGYGVRAFKATTGALVWSHYGGTGAGECSPAVANGVAYVGSGTGLVLALNARTGAKVWSFNAPIACDPGCDGAEAIGSSPVVAKGIVYVTSDEGVVYALDASTGVRLWTYQVTDSAEYSFPLVASGVLYVTFGNFWTPDGYIYALNARLGAKIWGHSIGETPLKLCPNLVSGQCWGGFISPPKVSHGRVYVGSTDGYVYAFKASSGAKVWNFLTGQEPGQAG
jgi:eukaryotic-like serine/threonine-protein kinase